LRNADRNLKPAVNKLAALGWELIQALFMYEMINLLVYGKKCGTW
jgi:hypothetical protein